MQWQIVYVKPGSADTFNGKPGRLFNPVPRSELEVIGAIAFLLARERPSKITITELGTTDAKPHHD